MLSTTEKPGNKFENIAILQNREVALEAYDISVKLGNRDIVRDVNLTIYKNEVLAIIGPSGCGKSTFIAALNGMLRYTLPSARQRGTVLLNGKVVHGADRDNLRREVAMVFQRPNPFPFSIRKNMEFALKAAGMKQKSEYPDRIETSLRSVSLWNRLKDRLDESASFLSGGEQQRLCIARALISDPKVILFDEPCSALDPISCRSIEELVLELKNRCAIAIVTHNIAQAKRVSDRCACFWLHDDSGQIIEIGSTESIMKKPQNSITRSYINGEFC